MMAVNESAAWRRARNEIERREVADAIAAMRDAYCSALQQVDALNLADAFGPNAGISGAVRDAFGKAAAARAKIEEIALGRGGAR